MKGARDKFIVVCIYRLLHCKKLSKLKDLGTCGSVMLPISLLSAQDVRDYFSLNAIESILNLFLQAGCFCQKSSAFTSFPVQLNRLEIENSILASSSPNIFNY